MLDIIRYLLRHRSRTSLTVLAAEANALNRITISPEEWDRPLTETTVRQLRRVEGVAGVTVTISERINEPEEIGSQDFFNPKTFAGARSDIPGLSRRRRLGARGTGCASPCIHFLRRGGRTGDVQSPPWHWLRHRRPSTWHG